MHRAASLLELVKMEMAGQWKKLLSYLLLLAAVSGPLAETSPELGE
jgi:hypothetical protein